MHQTLSARRILSTREVNCAGPWLPLKDTKEIPRPKFFLIRSRADLPISAKQGGDILQLILRVSYCSVIQQQ